MNRNSSNQLGSSLPSNLQSCESKIMVSGKVETALESLNQHVYHLGKIADDFVNLVQHPQPQQCSNDGSPCNGEPTLVEQINRIDANVDNAINTLGMVADIIRQNLGNIKLD